MEESALLFVQSVPRKKNKCSCLYDKYSHLGGDRASSVFYCSCLQHREYSCCCSSDLCSRRGGDISGIYTFRTKSIHKTIIIVYIINVPTVKEIGLMLR